jgi:4-hydroxy-4-methyl-2-oxoglutarate aldolase
LETALTQPKTYLNFYRDIGVVAVPAGIVQAVADAASAREANEGDKRRRLASGEIGLDLYKMREALQKAGLRYID